MALKYRESALTEQGIETVLEQLKAYLRTLNMEDEKTLNLCFTAKELLTGIMKASGQGTKVSVGLGRHFGRHILKIRYHAGPADSTFGSEKAWQGQPVPVFHRNGSEVTVSLPLSERKKRSTVFYTVLAVLSAVLLGAAGPVIPETFRQAAGDILLLPMSDSFLGLLKTFAGLMIFFTVISGITGMGSMEKLGHTGLSVAGRTLLASLVSCTLAILLVQPFLHLTFMGVMPGDTAQLKAVSQMIFDILPSGPIEPFNSSNFIQIIVMAMFVGAGLLAIGEKGAPIRDLTDRAAVLFQRIISFVSRFVPVFVFVMLLHQIWLGETDRLLSAWKPVLMIHLFLLALTVVLVLISSLLLKCSPGKLLKKLYPPFVIAFTTQSSMAVMSLSMDICEKKFGVDREMVSFLYPLDSMFFKLHCIVYYIVLVFCFAELYDLTVSLQWIVSAGILCMLLAVAAPPIPGSGLMVYTMMFLSLGFPADAIVLATAIEVVSDYAYTGCTVAVQILHIAVEAGRLGHMDRRVFMLES